MYLLDLGSILKEKNNNNINISCPVHITLHFIAVQYSIEKMRISRLGVLLFLLLLERHRHDQGKDSNKGRENEQDEGDVHHSLTGGVGSGLKGDVVAGQETSGKGGEGREGAEAATEKAEAPSKDDEEAELEREKTARKVTKKAAKPKGDVQEQEEEGFGEDGQKMRVKKGRKKSKQEVGIFFAFLKVLSRVIGRRVSLGLRGCARVTFVRDRNMNGFGRDASGVVRA